jgi:hypothetical protein
MKLRFVACLTLLCGLSSGYARCGQSDVQEKAKRTAPPVRSHEDSDSVAIQLEIWEVHGDEARALKDSGFRQLGGLLRAGGNSRERNGQANTVKELLDVLSRHAQLTGVIGPKLTTRLGRTTGVRMGFGVTSTHLHYMVRTGEKTFELQSLPAEALNSLGLTIDLTPQAVPNDPELITISPLKITFGTVDGHEPVPGVELEIGKPIISTRKLETSLTVAEGDAVAVVLPGPEGRQPILFLTVHRVAAAQPSEASRGLATPGSFAKGLK